MLSMQHHVKQRMSHIRQILISSEIRSTLTRGQPFDTVEGSEDFSGLNIPLQLLVRMFSYILFCTHIHNHDIFYMLCSRIFIFFVPFKAFVPFYIVVLVFVCFVYDLRW